MGRINMKVSELQIGDWVSCFGDSVRVTAVRTVYDDRTNPIGIMSPLKIEYFFKEENVKPVPLTEEILHNASLQERREDAEWYFEEFYEPNVWRLEINGTLNNIDINISYVHELQHALRLIGLNELADNLKI